MIFDMGSYLTKIVKKQRHSFTGAFVNDFRRKLTNFVDSVTVEL
jgi:hypothetical protein